VLRKLAVHLTYSSGRCFPLSSFMKEAFMADKVEVLNP